MASGFITKNYLLDNLKLFKKQILDKLYVPLTRTINGKSLSSNISLSPNDIGASAAKHTHTKSEVGLGNVDNTADANKSVKYATSAGSANSATTATTASKLGTNAGSTTHPVYFANGVPVEANVSSDFLVQGSNTIVFDCGNASA